MPNGSTPTESQIRRLEVAYEELSALLRPSSEAAARFRSAPGEAEWSVMETLGHVVEMIPFWIGESRKILAAQGEAAPFGRTLDHPGRLEGIKRGATADPAQLLSQLHDEVRRAAGFMRGLSAADLAAVGVHPRHGNMSVGDIVEHFIVAHTEEHAVQVKETLGRIG